MFLIFLKGLKQVRMRCDAKTLCSNSEAFPSVQAVFSDTIHDNDTMFKEAIMTFITLTEHFSELV